MSELSVVPLDPEITTSFLGNLFSGGWNTVFTQHPGLLFMSIFSIRITLFLCLFYKIFHNLLVLHYNPVQSPSSPRSLSAPYRARQAILSTPPYLQIILSVPFRALYVLIHWQIMHIFPSSLKAPQKLGIEKVNMNIHRWKKVSIFIADYRFLEHF